MTDTPTKTDLLPCPFCGIEPLHDHEEGKAMCSHEFCCAFGLAMDDQQWNTRTSPQAESDDGALNQLGVIARAHTKLEALSAPKSAKDGERQAALEALDAYTSQTALAGLNPAKQRQVVEAFYTALPTIRAALTAKPDEIKARTMQCLTVGKDQWGEELEVIGTPNAIYALQQSLKPDAAIDEKLLDALNAFSWVSEKDIDRDDIIITGQEILSLVRAASGRLSSKAEWQDISTAPDGKRVLIVTKIAMADGYYEPEICYRNGDHWFYEPGNRRLSAPTHWQPLPQPPIAGGDTDV